jgi:hypothetical protein
MEWQVTGATMSDTQMHCYAKDMGQCATGGAASRSQGRLSAFHDFFN